MTKLFLSTIMLLFGVMLGSLNSAPLQKKAAPKTVTILIKGFQFVPAKVEVASGDTVIWKNEDIVPHTATLKRTFDSKEIAVGKSWTYLAKDPGTYSYICTYHPTMAAQLIVK